MSHCYWPINQIQSISSGCWAQWGGQGVPHVSPDRSSFTPQPTGQCGAGRRPCLALGTQGCDGWQVNGSASLCRNHQSSGSEVKQGSYAAAALNWIKVFVHHWMHGLWWWVGGKASVRDILILTHVTEDSKHKDSSDQTCVTLIGSVLYWLYSNHRCTSWRYLAGCPTLLYTPLLCCPSLGLLYKQCVCQTAP